MAGFIPNAYAATLLDLIAGRVAQTAGTVYLGLATAVPEDPLSTTLATLTEVTTPGYARVAVPAFSAASTVAPVRTTSPTAFSFPSFTADQTIAATYAFLTNVATGTAGQVRYLFQLETPVLGRVGEPLNIPASTLVIE